MKRVLMGAGLLALAACSQAEKADDTATEPEKPAIVGTYEETTPDGELMVTTINADGTYAESVKGEVSESGYWSQAEGKTCFDPLGDDTPQRCFTTTEPGEDGTFTATPDEGDPITVKKIS